VIRAVKATGKQLPPEHELQIWSALPTAAPIRRSPRTCSVSVRTLRRRLRSVQQRLHTKTRAHAVAVGLEIGLLVVDRGPDSPQLSESEVNRATAAIRERAEQDAASDDRACSLGVGREPWLRGLVVAQQVNRSRYRGLRQAGSFRSPLSCGQYTRTVR
jgi:hypothetical protein